MWLKLSKLLQLLHMLLFEVLRCTLIAQGKNSFYFFRRDFLGNKSLVLLSFLRPCHWDFALFAIFCCHGTLLPNPGVGISTPSQYDEPAMRVRSKPRRFHSSLTFVDDIGL